MLTRWLVATLFVSAIGPLVACSGTTPDSFSSREDVEPIAPAAEGTDEAPPPPSRDPLAGFPKGADALAKLCAGGGDDAAIDALCVKPTPNIRSLQDLERALGLDFKEPSAGNARGGNPAFALTANSTALSGRFISAINPAVILFSPQRTERFVSTMFVRGENAVEIAAREPSTGRFVFYLVRYEQACDETDACTHADRLTAANERDWTSWSIYRDQDIANTVFDCLHCHQPGGPSSPTFLRMQERLFPWTHWLGQADESARQLVVDFEAAHGEESFGTIPPGLAGASDAAILEAVIDTFGPSPQPNEFDSRRIALEKVGDGVSVDRPERVPFGSSPTWQGIFDRAVAGEAIPVPYHDAKVTDPQKLGRMTRAYRSFLDGVLPAAQLPDIRDVLLDAALPDMGLVPKPGLDGRGILVQMCAQCHNASLDPSLSKSRFDVTKLDSMSPGMKSSAIARMTMDPKSVGHMPPAHFKSLEGEALQRAIDFLKR